MIKEGQAEAMAELAVAAVTGTGMDKIEFVNERYIYLPYEKVTKKTSGNFLQSESKKLKVP